MGRKAAMTGRVVALSECLQRVLSVDLIKLFNRMVDANVEDNDDYKDDVDYLKRGLLVSLLNPRHCVHRHMPRIPHSSACLVFLSFSKKLSACLIFSIVIHVTMIIIFI